MWQVEMEEDALHGGGQGDERNDPHLSRPRFARCPAGHRSGSTILDGDRDILDVAETLPVPAVSPRGFWEMLHGRR